eukprot:2359945-Prymnesium_polylepis.1
MNRILMQVSRAGSLARCSHDSTYSLKSAERVLEKLSHALKQYITNFTWWGSSCLKGNLTSSSPLAPRKTADPFDFERTASHVSSPSQTRTCFSNPPVAFCTTLMGGQPRTLQPFPFFLHSYHLQGTSFSSLPSFGTMVCVPSLTK